MKFIDQIKSYAPTSEQENNDKNIILEHIDAFSYNILTRSNELAHTTSSGFIMNKEYNKILMIHHNIYNTWTWTGGHSDGDDDLLKTALKEAVEETGVKNITPLFEEVASIDILPVWGHRKNGKYVSAHLHLNASFILIADEDEELIINKDETSGVKWVPIANLKEHSNEPYLLKIYFKLIYKARNNQKS